MRQLKDGIIGLKNDNLNKNGGVSMSEIKLKPCPFCRGEAVSGYNEMDMFYVACQGGCSAIIPYNNSIEEAIKEWNRRV